MWCFHSHELWAALVGLPLGAFMLGMGLGLLICRAKAVRLAPELASKL